MRLIFYTFVYIAGIALLSSVLAWVISSFVEFEYLKILSRTLLLLVALSLVPLWRLNGMSRELIGFRSFNAREFGQAVALSVVMLLPLMLLFLVSGFRVLDPRLEFLSTGFVQTLLVVGAGAFMVALFEETLFRGFLQQLVSDRLGKSQAIWLVAVCYGLVHFLEPTGAEVEEVSILTGVSLIVSAFTGMGSFVGEITSFACLVGIGVVLGHTRERVGLWIAIGLHAGWVLGIRTFKELTVRDVFSPYAEWTGTYDNFIGPLALFWLLFCFVLFRLHHLRRANLLGVSR